MIKAYIHHYKNHISLIAATLFLSGCNLVQYRPLTTIDKVDTRQGYRLEQSLTKRGNDDTFVVLMLSGGGTRAAALGYGVLEELGRQKIYIGGRETTLLESVDLVYGVSGGSVLAAYYSMHGKDTIPSFEQLFLKQNFQRLVTKQVFSSANLPRLASPEFGRGDLLQEQFENVLFGKTTFGDLAKYRKGPFAVISATDMAIGARLEFTQEYFDSMCLNLSDMRIARAVAASSAVPLVFAPVTLNNNGGNCGYKLPVPMQLATELNPDKQQNKTRRELVERAKQYENSRQRPYIHLLDGGLTDNLGLRGILDTSELYPSNVLQRRFLDDSIRKIVVINVNAQNLMPSTIDQSPAVPGFQDVINAVVNVPIDQYSRESLRRFRAFTDKWNEELKRNHGESKASLYFVSLNLHDLPDSPLRKSVLHIPTSFYLPRSDINNLKLAAHTLLKQSGEYKRMLKEMSLKPTNNRRIWFIGDVDEPEQPQQPPPIAPASGLKELYQP